MLTLLYSWRERLDFHVRLGDGRWMLVNNRPCVQLGELHCRTYCIGHSARMIGDCSLASSRPHSTGITCGDTETDEYTADIAILYQPTKYYGKMAPKRTTRANPADTTATTSVTNAQLKAMVDQGITDALAARDADRNTNGDDSHNLGAGVRRTERVARETVGHDVAYAITWIDLKKKMTDKYCPRGEIKKLEAELWNLKVKGTDVIGYNQRFQELVLLCVRMFPREPDKIERYVGGLPDMIHIIVVPSNPKIMQEAIEIATELMDKKIRTFAE
ncbi:reverse transcriptase domain-containing protein [Tanacetum coccineum]